MARSAEKHATVSEGSPLQSSRSQIRRQERELVRRNRRVRFIRGNARVVMAGAGAVLLTASLAAVATGTDISASSVGFWWRHPTKHSKPHRWPAITPTPRATPTAAPTSAEPTSSPTSTMPPATSTSAPTSTTTKPTTTATTATTAPAAPAPGAPAASTGWPGPSNTGVPNGTVLKDVSGDMTVSKAGTIVSGIQLAGCMTITAPNVTVENSIIKGRGCSAVVLNRSSDFTIKNSEIDGLGDSGVVGIGWSNFTAQGVEIRNVGDGAFPNGNATIKDSWIHNMIDCSGCHNDGVQITEGSGIVIDHNTIQNQLGQTSAVMIGADQDDVSNVTVSNNLLDGGGYALYGGKLAAGSKYSIGGITLTGNRFARTYFKDGGSWGPMAYASYPGCTASDNRWLDTGQAISA